MTPPNRARTPDELSEERHQQNLRKFNELNAEIEKTAILTRQALSESQSNRHAVKGLAASVESLIHLYEQDRQDRKEERQASEVLRIRELQKLEDARKEELKSTGIALAQQAEEIKKLNQKFIWATGLIAGLSIAFHEIGDLVSPFIRHLLQ